MQRGSGRAKQALSHVPKHEETFGSLCSSGLPPRAQGLPACSVLAARILGKCDLCAPRAWPGSVSAPGRGQPSRWIGHTNVTSTATCAPWKDGRPLATTSRRRASVMGSPRFNSRRKTSVATRPPASRQIWATTLSTGTARRTRTPAVAQAARWSPRMSNSPPQRHSRAVGGRGKRKRRSRVTRKTSSPMWYSGRVGKVVSTVLPPGPAWDNRSAPDAEVISEKSVSRPRGPQGPWRHAATLGQNRRRSMSHKGYAWPKAKATFVGSQWHSHQRKWLSPPISEPKARDPGAPGTFVAGIGHFFVAPFQPTVFVLAGHQMCFW